MTGRTHDLAAFTALNIVFVTLPIPQMSIATMVVAFGANMVGGLLPDIDEAASDIWDKFRGGKIIGELIQPLLGQHRMISHSFLGVFIIGYLLKRLLPLLGSVLLVNMDILWWSIMIGYLSHLLTDSLTTQGVPWLFPIPIRFGFPPIKSLRIKTGGLGEKIIIFPALLIINAYLIYAKYPIYQAFFKSYLK